MIITGRFSIFLAFAKGWAKNNHLPNLYLLTSLNYVVTATSACPGIGVSAQSKQCFLKGNHPSGVPASGIG